MAALVPNSTSADYLSGVVVDAGKHLCLGSFLQTFYKETTGKQSGRRDAV